MTSRSRSRTPASDRGTSSLELALVTPALLFLTLIIVQSAMWFHARQVAQAAVEQGAREARAYSGSAGKGESAARNSFNALQGNRVTQGPLYVNAKFVGDNVEVTLTTKAIRITPFLPAWPVSVKAGGPIEQFQPPGGP